MLIKKDLLVVNGKFILLHWHDKWCMHSEIAVNFIVYSNSFCGIQETSAMGQGLCSNKYMLGFTKSLRMVAKVVVVGIRER